MSIIAQYLKKKKKKSIRRLSQKKTEEEFHGLWLGRSWNKPESGIQTSQSFCSRVLGGSVHSFVSAAWPSLDLSQRQRTSVLCCKEAFPGHPITICWPGVTTALDLMKQPPQVE